MLSRVNNFLLYNFLDRKFFFGIIVFFNFKYMRLICYKKLYVDVMVLGEDRFINLLDKLVFCFVELKILLRIVIEE